MAFSFSPQRHLLLTVQHIRRVELAFLVGLSGVKLRPLLPMLFLNHYASLVVTVFLDLAL